MLLGAVALAIAAATPVLTIEAAEETPDLITVVLEVPRDTLARLAAAAPDESAWRAALAVGVAEPGQPPGPGLFGDYRIDGTSVVFQPRYPISPGLVVTADLDGASFDRLVGARGTPSLVATHRVPELDREPHATVVAISPVATQPWPENLLRFYLHFSAPMPPVDLAPLLRLTDAETAAAVAEPLVEVAGGLWDPGRTRATILIHPGRIKSGVGPRTALGPALEAGRRYQLTLRADSPSLPLAAPWSAEVVATAPDRHGPDPGRWRITPPAHPSAPLAVDLDASADPALLRRLVWVEDAAGRPVSGTAVIDELGRSWSLAPDSVWQPGRYDLVVSPGLEDLSGNQVGRAFEMPARGEVGGPERPAARLPFEVAAP